MTLLDNILTLFLLCLVETCMMILFIIIFLDHTVLKSKGEHSYLYNMKTGTVPLIIHGNGPIKVGHVLINWSKKMCYPFSWFKVIFLSFRAESFLFCHEVFINLCQKYNDIKHGRLIPDSIKIKAIRLKFVVSPLDMQH